MKKVIFPVKNAKLGKLKTGDFVEISGIIYTARDAAHKKLFDLVEKKRNLPFDLKGNLIYYVGPTPAAPGKIIGSCGPTTSARMDFFTPTLYRLGLKATMGKGERSDEIIEACRKYKSVYFVTFGGCGAYLSKFVRNTEVVAFEELETEAIYKLEVVNFPAIVCIDIYGNYLYKYNRK